MATISAPEARKHLREGNQRFVADVRRRSVHTTQLEREDLTSGQAPFAVILGCADSRVPAELVFDQGVGDLFVIRVAGNIAAPSQIASVEYAVAALGTRLVVVLGHTGCGAVRATLEAMDEVSVPLDCDLRSLVTHIRPAVEPVVGPLPVTDVDGHMPACVHANIHAASRTLRTASPVLARACAEAGLEVVGAEYDLATGAVTFLDDPT